MVGLMTGAAWVSGPAATVWLRVPRDALTDGFTTTSPYFADDDYAYLSESDGDRYVEEKGLDAGLVPDAYFRLPKHVTEYA